MRHRALNVILIVAGAIFQILGPLWLAANLSRERVELGDAGVLRKLWAWLVYWLGATSEPINPSVMLRSAFDFSATSDVARGMESEIQRLQRELSELSQRFVRFRTDTEERLAALEQSIREKHELLVARVEEIESRLREARRADLRNNRCAGRLFALGAALSAVGALI